LAEIDPAEEHRKPTNPRRAVFILLCMAVTIALFGLQVLKTSTLTISAVGKAGEYRLTGHQLHPTRLRVHVTGWLEGQATIGIPGQPAATIGPSNVDWTYSGAWVEQDCLLKYTPKTATMGSLSVEYRID
jgi:hypothetical protein